MSVSLIHNKNGEIISRAFPTYNGTYLKVPYLEFREIASPEPIEWAYGDYVDYRGVRYYLYDIPSVTKRTAELGRVGNSLVYSNVQFYSKMHDLELWPFLDIVLGDNGIHFSTQDVVATFEDVAGIRDRIQANLNYYAGSGVWNVVIADNLNEIYSRDDDTVLMAELIEETREFSIAGGSLFDALNKIFELWSDLGWTHTKVNGVETITIGGANVRTADNTTIQMKQGKGNGIVTIEDSQANRDTFGTRLYAYGSTRNMNFQYYRGDSTILSSESVDICNLMLPKRVWGLTDGKYDPKKAFLSQDENIFGIRPKVHYFDGGQDEEIYPTIERMTIKEVRNTFESVEDQYYPNPKDYPNPNTRVDMVRACTNPTDDGVISGGKREEHNRLIRMPNLGVGTHTVPLDTFSFASDGLVKMDGKLLYTQQNISGDIYLKVSETAEGETPIVVKSLHFSKVLNSHTLALSEEEIDVLQDCVYTIYLEYTISVPATTTSTLGVGGKSYASIDTTFTMSINQIGFDINERQALGSNGLCTIAITSGMNAGRSFVVKSCTHQGVDNYWILECVRAYDSSIGMAYPNNVYTIESGDTFVLLDIAMPDSYIKIAEERLLKRAQNLMERISKRQSYYTPNLDAIALWNKDIELKEGMYMDISDEFLAPDGEDIFVQIDTVTITENEQLPVYRVTLREEKATAFRKGVASTSAATSMLPGQGEGTTDYRSLNHKPSIEGVTIDGDKTALDFGLATRQWVIDYVAEHLSQ